MGAELPLLEPEEQVLSTLNRDGSRRWLRPRLFRGRFWQARRLTAYGLIALFSLLPHLRVAGKPMVLIDLVNREFTLVGFTFLPTDTVLLALLMIGLFVTIFLMTALLGRVWCGWACPQTVYLEFVYRPLERFFNGGPGYRSPLAKLPNEIRTILRLLVYLLVSLFLAHTFLAYFVGTERLWDWMQRSPLEHPTPFLIMFATTAAMMFDFTYFREQTCIVACPYGRFQSVMLDRDSLIVTYDEQRGEPRAKPSRNRGEAGDCIDCSLCVTTCPTGIDIRKGLQLECVACTQCIDACDTVMDKIGKPRGLIRYSSQRSVEEGTSRLLRPRVIFYPLILVAVATGFFFKLSGMRSADVHLTRGQGSPFSLTTEGAVQNALQLKITSRAKEPRTYHVEVLDPAGADLVYDADGFHLAPREMARETILIKLPPEAFTQGICLATLRVFDQEGGFSEELQYKLIGPHRPTAGSDP